MNLKQLQAEWLEKVKNSLLCHDERITYASTCNDLTPHIQQQEADMALFRRLIDSLDRTSNENPDEVREQARARLAEYEGEKK